MEISRMADDIVRWIEKQVKAAGVNGVVVGLSGGIDSTVVAKLASRATAVTGVALPCCSALQDSVDAKVAGLSCSKVVNVSLAGIDAVLIQVLALNQANDYKTPEEMIVSYRLPKANLTARLRMAVLYFFANLNNLLVCGTTNKSELLTGYYTKYGDGGVDIEPIADVWKTDVWKLAKHLDVPQGIIDKAPTAGLWAGQTDEAELGMPYDKLDYYLKIISNALEQGAELEPSLLLPDGHEDEFKRVLALFETSCHKRVMPPRCHLWEVA